MERGMSEFDLIKRLERQSRAARPVLTGIGDDASVTLHGGPTATSVDAVVDGVHFRRQWSSPARIAAKAVATALSDLAAMAADPGEVYVTLGLPVDTPTGYLEELADGFIAAARQFGVALTGGDTVASPVLFASVTVVGRAPEGQQLILRSGAQHGDLVAVTGCFGGAAAGLLLLENQSLEQDSGIPEREALIERQISPRPRLAEGSGLRGTGVTSLVDVSDGLIADLGHIAKASGVAVQIDGGLVPVQAGVAEVAAAAGLDPLDLALAGGEDYELAMTLPPGLREAVKTGTESAGCDFTVVGKVNEGSGVDVLGGDPDRASPGGYDHFR
jgi:thiamine-monophosphate kinase